MQSVTKGELSVDMKLAKKMRIKVRLKGALQRSHDGLKSNYFVGTISARARNLAGVCICVKLLWMLGGVHSGDSSQNHVVLVRYSILFKLRQLWLRIKGSNNYLMKMEKKKKNRDGISSPPIREMIQSSSKCGSEVPRINFFSMFKRKNSNPENGTNSSGMKNIFLGRSNSSESAAEKSSSSSLARFFSSCNKTCGKQKVSKVQSNSMQEFYRQSGPILAQDVGMLMMLVILMQQALSGQCRYL